MWSLPWCLRVGVRHGGVQSKTKFPKITCLHQCDYLLYSMNMMKVDIAKTTGPCWIRKQSLTMVDGQAVWASNAESDPYSYLPADYVDDVVRRGKNKRIREGTRQLHVAALTW